MIEIRKITDYKLIETLTEKFKLSYSGNECFIGVSSNNEILEFMQYSIVTDHIEIKYISDITNDFMLIDGLIKTLLFTTDITSIKSVLLPKYYEMAAKVFNFTDHESYYKLKLEDYNNGCCKGKE